MIHFDQADLNRLRGVYARFDAEPPLPVVAADNMVDAANSVRSLIHSELEPPIIDLTPSTITKVIERNAVWNSTIDHRKAAATSALAEAAHQQRIAWDGAVPELHGTFGPWFAVAADRFTTALAELNGVTDIEANVSRGLGEVHERAVEAAAELNELRLARAVLGGRVPGVDRPFWEWTQIVTLGSLDTAVRLGSAVRVSGIVHAPDPVAGSLVWWSRLVAVEGVRLQWHTEAEQIELRARTPLHDPAGATAA